MAASRREKQGQCRTACETKRGEGQVRKVNWEKQWVTGSPQWIGRENKEHSTMVHVIIMHTNTHSYTQRCTQLQNHLLHTFSSNSFTRVDNKRTTSSFKGGVEAARIHSGEVHQLYGHKTRNNEGNQLSEQFPPFSLLNCPWKCSSLI